MRWFWIDRFLEFNSGTTARAIKNVSLAEDHLHDHFPGYPVMPGSLGIEAIIQAMQVFAQQQSNCAAPARLVTGQKMNWIYRGQVLQSHRQMRVETHFQKVQQVGKTRQFNADASLWADDTRIYEVHNMAIAIEEE